MEVETYIFYPYQPKHRDVTCNLVGGHDRQRLEDLSIGGMHNIPQLLTPPSQNSSYPITSRRIRPFQAFIPSFPTRGVSWMGGLSRFIPYPSSLDAQESSAFGLLAYIRLTRSFFSMEADRRANMESTVNFIEFSL